MSTYTTDSSTINLRDILSVSFTEEHFKIVDYVYDATPDDDDYIDIFGTKYLKSVIDRKNSVFVCELTLKVNTESFFNSPIDGYVVRISPEDDHTNFYQQVCYFSDDFEGIIDIGELDTKEIKRKLNEAKTFMSYETPSGDGALSTVTTQVASNYVNLDAGSDFSSLAKNMLTQGLSAVEELHLTMPTFALPSAKTNFGAVGHSSAPYASGLIEKEARTMYGYPGFTDDKISLSDQRKASQQDATDSEASYALQSSIRSSGEQPNPQTSIVLGRIYKYTADYFVSKRKFEIPRSFIDGNSLASHRIKISFKPFILDENLIDSATGLHYEPTFGDFFTKDINPERDFLFTPKNPPSIRVMHTSPSLISYEVNRGDPVVELIQVIKSYYNPVTGQIHSSDFAKLYVFESTKDTIAITNEACQNVAPSYPMIGVATVVNGALGLTNSIVSKSFPNTLYSGYSRQDTSIVTAFNDFEGITVEVTSIPREVFKITLYREDLALPISAENRTKKLVVSAVGSAAELSFLDIEVASRRRYRYFVKCERSSGAAPRNLADSGMGQSFGPVGTLYEEYMASDDEVVDRIDPSGLSLFNVSISHAGSSYGVHQTSHVFNIDVSPKDTDFGFVVESLRRDGLLDVYLDELTDRKDDLSTIVAFIVERINRETGERITLSTLAKPGQAFKDTTPTLTARDSVTYIFKMCLMNPVSFITATSPGESSADRTASLAAISSAFTTSTGITPIPDSSVSTSSLTSAVSGIVSQSHTGQDFALTVYKSPDQTKPTNFTGTAPPGMGVILTWEIPYTLESKTQAFIVNCSLNGIALAPRTVSVILGDGTNRYTYLDLEYYSEVGTKSYSIQCMFNDFTIGPSTDSISYTRTATVDESSMSSMEIVSADPALVSSFADDFGPDIF